MAGGSCPGTMSSTRLICGPLVQMLAGSNSPPVCMARPVSVHYSTEEMTEFIVFSYATKFSQQVFHRLVVVY